LVKTKKIKPKPSNAEYQMVSLQPRPRQMPVGVELVYFVRCENFIKIGVSTSPRYRAHSFRTGNPFDCRLIGLVKGGRLFEKELHKRFASRRHRDEWFHHSDELEAEIAVICGDWFELDKNKSCRSYAVERHDFQLRRKYGHGEPTGGRWF
jgi:hypothetical protein